MSQSYFVFFRFQIDFFSNDREMKLLTQTKSVLIIKLATNKKATNSTNTTRNTEKNDFATINKIVFFFAFKICNYYITKNDSIDN